MMLQHNVTTHMLQDSPPPQYGLSECSSHCGVVVAAVEVIWPKKECYVDDSDED